MKYSVAEDKEEAEVKGKLKVGSKSNGVSERGGDTEIHLGRSAALREEHGAAAGVRDAGAKNGRKEREGVFRF